MKITWQHLEAGNACFTEHASQPPDGDDAGRQPTCVEQTCTSTVSPLQIVVQMLL